MYIDTRTNKMYTTLYTYTWGLYFCSKTRLKSRAITIANMFYKAEYALFDGTIKFVKKKVQVLEVQVLEAQVSRNKVQGTKVGIRYKSKWWN